MNRLPFFLSWAVLIGLAAHTTHAADRVVHLNGDTVEVRSITGSADALRIDNQPVDLQQVRSIHRAIEPDRVSLRAIRLYLADGSVIIAGKAQIDGDAVVFDWSVENATRWPIETVRAVLLRPMSADNMGRLTPERDFADALEGEGPADDALYVIRDEGITVVPGVLESLGPDDARFVWNDRSRSVGRDKLYGLSLAQTTKQPDHAGQVCVSLKDGSRIWGTFAGLNDNTLTLTRPGGVSLELKWDGVCRLDVSSRYMTFLSDIDPAEQTTDAILGSESWVPRRDALVMSPIDEPIKLSDRTYEKGLGVRSMTTLTYDIDGKYARFAATIGFDDYWEKGLGDGTFIVKGDDRVLAEHRMTAADAPIELDIAIEGVSKLTLYIDPHEDDTGDSAAWADARLIRATPASE